MNVLDVRATLRRLLGRLPDDELKGVATDWSLKAHEGQGFPPGDWRLWLMLAGRGFGKTRTGAEWVSEMARRDGRARIALVGATMDEVARVMVLGESGLMKIARDSEDVIWRPATGTVTFRSGAQAFAYSGEAPDKLRGPEHHFAWCDEIAKWRYPEETWDNLQLTLRLGARPRVLVTTTPRPIALVKKLLAEADRVSRGRMTDNPHLPAAFAAGVTALYGGTRFARQELLGEIVEEVEGALWRREMLEGCRVKLLPELARGGGPSADRLMVEGPARSAGEPSLDALVESEAPPPAAAAPPPPFGWSPSPSELGEDFVRIVIGVDPPVSAAGDACGIVACGLGADGVGHVLGDHSVSGLSPEGWARAVAAAAEAHGADRVIAGEPGRRHGGERASGRGLRAAGPAGAGEPGQGGPGGAGRGAVRK